MGQQIELSQFATGTNEGSGPSKLERRDKTVCNRTRTK
jgi:hypothetical protein